MVLKIFKVQKWMLTQIVLFLSCILFNYEAIALRESRSINNDHRIRNIVYVPDQVFKFIGHYGYQTTIEFAAEESVTSIVMGDTTAWQILPSHNKLFIKPIEENATTNMYVTTDKKTYLFELEARDADNIYDPELIFILRFLYADDMTEIGGGMSTDNAVDETDDISAIDNPEEYNFNYTVIGHEDILPIKIYDDGEFTYLFFQDKNGTIPAMFYVNEDNRDYVINYRLSKFHKNAIIIEGIFPRISLRAGKQNGCIYNEGYRAHSPVFFPPADNVSSAGLEIVEEPLL